MVLPSRARRASVSCVLAGTALALVGCSALASAAISIGSTLLTSAVSNYNPAYGAEVKNLLQALRSEFRTQPTAPPAVGALPGGDGDDVPPPVDTGGDVGVPGGSEVPPPLDSEAAAGDEPGDGENEDVPLSLEVALLRQQDVDGRVESVAIEDGDVLRDTRADGTSDRFKIFFRANRPAYVYVVLVDGTGWVQPLFPGPASSLPNPVGAAEDRFLPEGELAFALDSYRGVETIYFVVSPHRRPDLEKALRAFAAKRRTTPPRPTPVAEPEVLTRGVRRAAPGSRGQVRTRSGIQPFATTRFLSDLGKGSLVLTRWFRHE